MLSVHIHPGAEMIITEVTHRIPLLLGHGLMSTGHRGKEKATKCRLVFYVTD